MTFRDFIILHSYCRTYPDYNYKVFEITPVTNTQPLHPCPNPHRSTTHRPLTTNLFFSSAQTMYRSSKAYDREYDREYDSEYDSEVGTSLSLSLSPPLTLCDGSRKKNIHLSGVSQQQAFG